MSGADPRASRRPEVLPTNPRSTFENAGSAGVNKVIGLEDWLLVGNIGRNFELWRVDAGGVTGSPSIFDTTIYPSEDVPSQLDIDVHAAFVHQASGSLLVVNHYGLLRAFDLPLRHGQTLQPRQALQSAGDTERLIMLGDSLVVSSPRGQLTVDAAQPGLFISEPIAAALRDHVTPPQQPYHLRYRQELAEWGVVTAMAAADGLLAVAAVGRLGMFETCFDEEGAGMTRCLWQTELPYYTQWLGFDGRGRLLAAGYDPATDDPEGDNWEACSGGGVSALSATDGQLLLEVTLPESTAWGYGSEPVTPSRDGARLYALDRRGGLYEVDTAGGRSGQLFEAPAVDSMGIGHCELRGGALFAGFSRGDYRVFRYPLA